MFFFPLNSEQNAVLRESERIKTLGSNESTLLLAMLSEVNQVIVQLRNMVAEQDQPFQLHQSTGPPAKRPRLSYESNGHGPVNRPNSRQRMPVNGGMTTPYHGNTLASSNSAASSSQQQQQQLYNNRSNMRPPPPYPFLPNQ